MLWFIALASAMPSTSVEAVLGWTAEDQVAIRTASCDDVYSSDRDESFVYCSRQVEVWDAASGTVSQTFLVGVTASEDPDAPSLDPVREQPLQTAEWGAFQIAHPLTAGTSSRVGPAGVQLDVRAEGAEGATWTGDVFGLRVSPTGDDVPPALTVGLSRRGEGSWPQWTQGLDASAMAFLPYSVSARWSPGGRYAALVVTQDAARTMRGALLPSSTVRVVPAAPLISVLSPPAMAGARGHIADHLRSLRVGAVNASESLAERETSIVYFADGFESQARAIAARVPGGASVEPMTWDGAQHVVVALGTSVPIAD